ncbi:MAG TPA: hypothetical protein VIU64_17760 [Polyangia bacterium]
MAKRDRGVAIVSFAVMVLVLVGCLFGRSEESVRSEFEAYVKGASACTAASECAIAGAGCPLGCFAAVRSDRVADVEEKARQLVSEYERGGKGCAYDCAGPGPLRCIEGHCNADPDLSGGWSSGGAAGGAGGAGGGG